MTDHLSDLARYLKELKKQSGFTLDQLARELRDLGASTGASKQYLSMLMKGSIKEPSGEVLSNLAVALAKLSDKFDEQAYWRRTGGLQETAKIVATTSGARGAFVAMLQERGLSAKRIDDVLRQVDIRTIHRVVQGEEPLIIKHGTASSEEIASHRQKGYDVLALESDGFFDASQPGRGGRSPSEPGPLDYLESFREDFDARDARRKEQKTESHHFEAGRARIEVCGPITDQQRAAIAAIAVAVEQLLEH